MMQHIESPIRNPARLAAIRGTALLDSPPEEAFDRLARVASAALHAPGALLTLVDAERQFFKSAVGLREPWRTRRQTPLSHSFCRHVVERAAPLVVEDSLVEPLVRSNPAIGELGIRAYAGIPVRGGTGHVLGDLCVFAGEPRPWAHDEVWLLGELAGAADHEIERRAAEVRVDGWPGVAEERYRMVVRATRAAVWEWDPGSGRLVWSRESPGLLRFGDGEMGGTFGWWYGRLHPDERQTLLARLHAALEGTDETWSCDHRFLRGDGTYAVVVDCCAILRDGGGRAVRVVGAMTDVSERSREEEMQRFLARASTLLNESLHGEKTCAGLAALAVPALGDCCLVDMVDERGGLRRVALAHADPHLERLLRERNAQPEPDGVVAEVVRSGNPVLAAEAPDEADGDGGVRLPVHGLDVRSYMVLPLAAHERVLGAITLAAGASGRRYGPADLLSAGDLAHRAALAIEHARLYAESREAVRAREEVLGVISHDLRNPLNVMRLTTELLLDQAQERRSENVQKLELLQRACARMNRMVEDLLDVSSMEAGRLALRTRERSVAELVDEAESLLRPLAEQKSVSLECAVEDGLPRVRMDADRVLRVLSNLVGNAVKFTPEGGRVSLRVERAQGAVRFRVADTGPGIPGDLLPHVFGRYWQARRGDRRGAGLGLHIARGIVEAHGGEIWAESPPGSGAVVTFTLPQTPPAA